MEASTGKAVRAALVKAQAKMKAAKKDATNPHFGSSYADLASVADAVRGPFAENGLGWRHDISSDADGVRVSCIIFHESGEEILPSSPFFLPIPKKDPQAYKSGVTYGKRTTLEAAAGIATDQDDDGNAASVPGPKAPARPTPQEHVSEETGEVTEGAPAGAYGPVISWGKDKGRHASELSRKDLAFHVQAARKSIADPKWAKKKEHHEALLADLLAVAQSKGWVNAEGANE